MSREPKYSKIADDLRAAITAGEYQSGDRIPGENALMERYGVARMTARQALATLQQEGLTTTKTGVGVFVRGFEPIIRHGIERLSREQWGAGRAVWDSDATDRERHVDQIKIAEEPATDATAAALAVAEGTLMVVRRRRYLLDGEPVMLGVSSIPAAIAAGTAIAQPNTGKGGVLARLRELGHEAVRFREDIRSRMPTADEKAQLELAPGTPVITVHRTTLDSAGVPVDYTVMTLDASSYVLRYEFEA